MNEGESIPKSWQTQEPRVDLQHCTSDDSVALPQANTARKVTAGSKSTWSNRVNFVTEFASPYGYGANALTICSCLRDCTECRSSPSRRITSILSSFIYESFKALRKTWVKSNATDCTDIVLSDYDALARRTRERSARTLRRQAVRYTARSAYTNSQSLSTY